jgi:hydrogenase maturation factor
MADQNRLRVGKLPMDMLAKLLGTLELSDPRIVVGPRVGLDAAVVRTRDGLLVAKTDPITFATDLIGWYAVNVNANDVACMGARPLWFMATLLLPEGAEEGLAKTVFEQVSSACSALEIAVVGGHTEITHGLSRPIVVGCLLGEVEGDKPITAGGAMPGDDIVVTKGIAVEGTALLAREASQEILAKGVKAQLVERAAGFLFDPGISVVRDAQVARGAAAVHSLHDPTEGGLATGLEEVARASGVGLMIEADHVPVLEECRAITEALGLDPMGLIASGCLVITVPPRHTGQLVSALEAAGIAARRIGKVVEPEQGLVLIERGVERPLPRFERDELARFFEG